MQAGLVLTANGCQPEGLLEHRFAECLLEVPAGLAVFLPQAESVRQRIPVSQQGW